MKNVNIIDNPFAKDALSHLRDKNTDRKMFRYYADRLSFLLISNLVGKTDMEVTEIETPLVKTKVDRIVSNFIIIPILRSGIAMLPSALQLLPNAKVGFAGLVRNEKTAVAREYYWKIPEIEKTDVILIVDPMLATGGSILHVIRKIVQEGAKDVRIASIVASLGGIKKIHKAYPKIQITTAAVDEKLSAQKYIVPGLGDFGDRYFGTEDF